MDHKLDFKRVGWTVAFFSVIMHVMAMIRMATLSGESRAFMERLAAVGHPGFVALNAGSIVILLVEAFVYGWVLSAIFVSLYNVFYRSGKS